MGKTMNMPIRERAMRLTKRTLGSMARILNSDSVAKREEFLLLLLSNAKIKNSSAAKCISEVIILILLALFSKSIAKSFNCMVGVAGSLCDAALI